MMRLLLNPYWRFLGPSMNAISGKKSKNWLSSGCVTCGISYAAYVTYANTTRNHATWNQNKCQLTEPFPSAIFSKNPKQKNLYSSTVPTDENFFFGFLPKNALSDDSAFWIFPWDLPIRVKFRRNN